MKTKNISKYNIVILVAIAFLALVVYLASTKIVEDRTQAITNSKYELYSKNIKDEVALLIQNKKESTLSIALSLSITDEIISSLQNDTPNLNKLKHFSALLREQTGYKNVWFQVINKKGTSIFRSWTEKRGDSMLKARIDIANMIKNPKASTTISTGKFDMTFKSMVPVYNDEHEFIGIFEVITHFNSISRQLAKNNINAIFLVDKKYKKQLTKAFTKMFVKDYYIANLDAKSNLISYIGTHNIEKIINIPTYKIDTKNNKLITIYHIPDIHGNPMGYTILFKQLNSFNLHEIEYVKQNIIFYSILIIFSLIMFAYYLISKKHSDDLDNEVQERTSELETERKYIQKILDTNPSIIVVTSYSNIQRANQRFFDFFNYDSIEDFKKEHSCVCEFFVSLNDIPFPEDRMINDKLWCNYLAESPNKKDHYVTMKLNDELFYFTINAIYLNEEKDILLTFQNITDLKQKDKLLFEQTKMASMGEMIGNIAHQWRQPLSVISTSATGLQVYQEYNTLTDEKIQNACDTINHNAQYLSSTIDDFKNFIKGENKKTDFYIKHTIDQLLQIINPIIKNNNIQVIFNIQEELHINGYSNELIQCMMNIFNNAKDVLIDKEEEERYIFPLLLYL
jgi:nitrogen-specific signal transduction histidine kinase